MKWAPDGCQMRSIWSTSPFHPSSCLSPAHEMGGRSARTRFARPFHGRQRKKGVVCRPATRCSASGNHRRPVSRARTRQSPARPTLRTLRIHRYSRQVVAAFRAELEPGVTAGEHVQSPGGDRRDTSRKHERPQRHSKGEAAVLDPVMHSPFQRQIEPFKGPAWRHSPVERPHLSVGPTDRPRHQMHVELSRRVVPVDVPPLAPNPHSRQQHGHRRSPPLDRLANARMRLHSPSLYHRAHPTLASSSGRRPSANPASALRRHRPALGTRRPCRDSRAVVVALRAVVEAVAAAGKAVEIPSRASHRERQGAKQPERGSHLPNPEIVLTATPRPCPIHAKGRVLRSSVPEPLDEG